MQSGIIKSQVVPYFVEHRCPDLRDEFIVGQLEGDVRIVEYGDAVRGDTEVVNAPVGEWYTFIDAEQTGSVRILGVRCPAFNDHCDVFHLRNNPLREIVERSLHCGFERTQIHWREHNRRAIAPPIENDGGAIRCG